MGLSGGLAVFVTERTLADLFDLTIGRVCIPEGYAELPIQGGDDSVGASALRVCVLVRVQADEVGGQLVQLRDQIDARVYLGCVCDQAGTIHRWVEVWVQDLSQLEHAPSSYRQALSNAILDECWWTNHRAFADADPALCVTGGWEQRHPLLTLLDVEGGCAVHPVEEQSGEPWRVCCDEGVLSARGLPGYGTSLHRYGWVESLGEDSPMVVLTAGGPLNSGVRPVEEVVGGGLLPWNLGGGLLMVRAWSPFGFDQIMGHLKGVETEGFRHGKTLLDVGQLTGMEAEDAMQPRSDGWLMCARHSASERMLESLYLRLKLIGDAIEQVRAVTRATQRPILDLGPGSFQVRLGEPGCGLPFLWTARTKLMDAGRAVALPVAGGDASYYMHSRGVGASIYRPQAGFDQIQGRGSFRIRESKVHGSDGTGVVDGTFSTQERVDPSRSDLVWIRAQIGSERVDLQGTLERDSALAQGEWRFRSFSLRFDDEQMGLLRSAEGVPMPDVAFEIVPLLSTPCDLYAIAVLAVGGLLVDGDTTLAVALDEVLSLARQLGSDHDDMVGLGDRIVQLFDSDSRWVESLGPHRLVQEKMTAEEAFGLIPVELWAEVLGAIVRMVPGMGPDSWCRDLGQVRPGALHRVFDGSLGSFDKLVQRTRGLLVGDSWSNDEVQSVIDRMLMALV